MKPTSPSITNKQNSVLIPMAIKTRPLVLQNLGRYTKIGGAILIMAIIGGAIFLLYGLLAESINVSNAATPALTRVERENKIAYIILLPTYLIILFFAFKGHKYKSWSRK
jgi:FHS family L-fucose permease-like MFS transporter